MATKTKVTCNHPEEHCYTVTSHYRSVMLSRTALCRLCVSVSAVHSSKGHCPPESSDRPCLCSSTLTVEERALERELQSRLLQRDLQSNVFVLTQRRRSRSFNFFMLNTPDCFLWETPERSSCRNDPHSQWRATR